MLDITFYKFNKNENSTKIVNVDGEAFQCVLIEPTDIINPRIALTHGNPTEYNYAHIPIFNRYYFVNNWSWSGGRWVALLNVDVLASFKTEIGLSRQYVVRSASQSDGTIIDTLYPTKSNPISTFSLAEIPSDNPAEKPAENPFVTSLTQGLFIVGIINGDTSAVGCVSYYAFTSSEFRNFCNHMFGTGTWMFDGIEEIGEELTKVLFNPFQYVASCIWLPVPNIGTIGGGSVKYGWWELSINARQISGEPRLVSVAFSIPKHPQNAKGSYLNGNPFSRYELWWPCFGVYPLDADKLSKCRRLMAQCFIDPISGIGTLNVVADNVDEPGSAGLLSVQVQVGVPIQIAQMAANYIGAAGSIVGAVGNATTLNIGGFFDSIGDAVTNAMPQLSTSGKNGGIGAFMFPPTLNATFYTVVDDDVEHRGRPLMKDVVLNTLSGYILCNDAELECSCTANELQNIKSYLNGGFYYE